jgi:hypothetical protein
MSAATGHKLCHDGVALQVPVPHWCACDHACAHASLRHYKEIDWGRRRSGVSLVGGQAGATWGQGVPLLNVDRSRASAISAAPSMIAYERSIPFPTFFPLLLFTN